MKLYYHPASTVSRMVMLFAAHEGIALDYVLVDLMTGAQHQPEYKAVNPNALVPVLDDDGFVLTESAAILRYLAAKTGSAAYPADLQARARVDEAMAWFYGNFYKDSGYNLVYPQLFPHHKRRSDEAHSGAIEWGKTNSQKWLQILNDHWIGPKNDYLTGNEITVADYFGSGLVTLGEVLHMDFSKYPNVARWLGNMKKLPHWNEINEVFHGLVASTKGKDFERV